MQVKTTIILVLSLLVGHVQGFLCCMKSKTQVLNNYDPARMRDHDLKIDLLWYCKTGNIKGIQAILSAGINMNAYDLAWEEDQFNETPLMVAVRYNQHATVKYLLHVGADVNCLTSTYRHGPLYWASIYSDATMVKMLLDHGAKTDLGDGRSCVSLLDSVQNRANLARKKLEIERCQKIIVVAKQNAAWNPERSAWVGTVVRVSRDKHPSASLLLRSTNYEEQVGAGASAGLDLD